MFHRTAFTTWFTETGQSPLIRRSVWESSLLLWRGARDVAQPTKMHSSLRKSSMFESICSWLIAPTPMMFCLPQTCRAARGRPTGGRTRPQAGFAFARFPLSQSIFGTARSRQGRAVCARRSEPLTARTVLEHEAEGKAGRGFQGVSPWRGSGAAPRAPCRARFLRAVSKYPAAFQDASASTKFGKSSNTQLFFNVR